MNPALPLNSLQLVFSAITLVLCVASASVGIARRYVGPASVGEIALRVRTWWVMVATFGVAMLLGRTATITFLALLSFVSIREYFSMVRLTARDRGAVAGAYGLVLVFYGCIAAGWSDVVLAVVPALILIAMPMALLHSGETRAFLNRLAVISWGVLAFVYGLGHLALIQAHDGALNPVAGGAGLMLFVVVIAQASDVCQYLVGKTMGRRQVAPTISPNKTVAGFVGGVVLATVLAWGLAPFLTPLAGLSALGAGFVIAIAGFMGDLTLSAIKRDAGRKDCGSLLPGHGGVLDRVDSLILSAPAFHIYLHATS